MAKAKVTGKGPPCFRCGRQTLKFAHKEITGKQLSQPFYYAYWFRCMNDNCPTTLIMPEAGKVLNTVPRPPLSANQVVWGDNWNDVPTPNERPPWE